MKFTQDEIDYAKMIAKQPLLPYQHREYLYTIRDKYDFHPKTVYDIGSCVLSWTKKAEEVWDSEYILFDAFELFESIYKENPYKSFDNKTFEENNPIEIKNFSSPEEADSYWEMIHPPELC